MDTLASNFRGETVLLFGSQSLSFDANTFNAIRSSLEKEDYLRWIRHTVADLPSALKTALQHVPQLEGSEEWALSAVQELNDWLDSGHQPNSLDPSALPNTILTPLVVILHLSQYMKHSISTNDYQDDALLSKRQQETCETLGLCIGLLPSPPMELNCSRRLYCNFRCSMVHIIHLDGKKGFQGQLLRHAYLLSVPQHHLGSGIWVCLWPWLRQSGRFRAVYDSRRFPFFMRLSSQPSTNGNNPRSLHVICPGLFWLDAAFACGCI